MCSLTVEGRQGVGALHAHPSHVQHGKVLDFDAFFGNQGFSHDFNRGLQHLLNLRVADVLVTGFAEVLDYSIGWIKKWLGRFREQKFYDVEDFKSCSRAPKNPFRKVLVSRRGGTGVAI